jgi:hypothetical protein
MTNTRRPDTRTRHFAGEAEGNALVQYLNSDGEGQPRADLAEALQCFREVREAISRSGKHDLLEVFRDEAMQAKIQNVQTLLSQYPFRPVLAPSIKSYSFEWIPTWVDLDAYMLSKLKGPYKLEHALVDVMKLVNMHVLTSVRQCRCGKWIFPPKVKHCSESCLQDAYRSSPEWLAYRRDWAKRNRAAEKALAAGAIKRVRRGEARHGKKR